MTEQTELINRAEKIITYSELHGKSYDNFITTRAATFQVTALVIIR